MSEFVTILIMSAALGMDAFSVTLGMGMLGLRSQQIFRIGLTIGLFHIAMPLLGMVFGKWLSLYFDMVAVYIGGGLLLLIGLQMILSAFSTEGHSFLKPVGWGLAAFAVSVSLDSFSAGLSFGILGAKVVITVLMIGLVSMLLSWAGLMIGTRFQKYIGIYGELLGGCILIGFGVKIMLPL